MLSNKRFNLSALTLLVCLGGVISGCGGSGSSNSTANVFAGSYNGTWTSSDGDVGTANIVVTSSGTYSGSTNDTTKSVMGTLSGSITNGGNVTAQIVYPGVPATSATGSFAKNSDGTVTGTVSATISGVVETDTYTFTPNANM